MIKQEQMKIEATKYLLSLEDWCQTAFLIKSKGDVKVSHKRAIEWINAGIDSFEGYSKQEMLDIINSWK